MRPGFPTRQWPNVVAVVITAAAAEAALHYCFYYRVIQQNMQIVRDGQISDPVIRIRLYFCYPQKNRFWSYCIFHAGSDWCWLLHQHKSRQSAAAAVWFAACVKWLANYSNTPSRQVHPLRSSHLPLPHPRHQSIHQTAFSSTVCFAQDVT